LGSVGFTQVGEGMLTAVLRRVIGLIVIEFTKIFDHG
jgi:hypothetical protein